MVTFDKRKIELLQLIVRDYIKTARPVASGRLVEDYDLKMSPATARNEMLALDELGYLEQPHHSAGRVPTESAYRFFVEKVGEGSERPLIAERIAKEFGRAEDVFEAAVRIIAARAQNLGLGGWFSRPESFRFSGLADMLRQPEFLDPEIGASFVEAMEEMLVRQEELRGLVEEVRQDAPRVYIGKENPIKTLRGWSTVVAHVQDGDEGVVAIIGPTRMPYHENILLAAALARLIENIVS